MDQPISVEQYLSKLQPGLSDAEKEAIRTALATHINHLIIHDFDQLIRVLYTVDVPEQKLRAMIHSNPDVTASVIIADLLLQRQEEKLRTRASFKPREDISEDEKW